MFTILLYTILLITFIIRTPQFNTPLKKYLNLTLILVTIAVVCINAATGSKVPDIIMYIILFIGFLPTLLKLGDRKS
ncbi:hypothetical protein C0674_06470 [Sporolactobacillus terrae]|uniref:Uncharacterized protein n=1 Tax=Sporolactobacillus terrae TaxID=269673 RepID=A0ABX5Q6M9_9BACL|nr:hypothetical protein C0674_06470 [Sporolactobacillus terrae]QAA25266.1 hypothetical protein C0679_06450 [Sporolactobacillus terrae]